MGQLVDHMDVTFCYCSELSVVYLRTTNCPFAMEELTDLKGYLKASNADGTAIFEATADWCPNCKAIAPFIEKLVHKYPDARFYSYNTDKALDISQELSAHQMPTFHVFKDGDLRESVTGAKAKEIEKAIADNYDGKKIEE